MGIKKFLIKTAYQKRECLKISRQEIKRFQEAVKEIWIHFNPEPEIPDCISAVDGSRNRKEFAGYILYAVGAGSVFFRKGKLSNEENYLVDVDILKPEEYSDARLRILMGILEIKEALKTAEKVSYVFIDGSIIGSIIRPTVFSYEIEVEIKKEVEKLFKELVKNFSLSKIDSKNFYSKIENFATGKAFPVAAGYLEYLEYLYSLYLLLENFSKKIVAISKRSDSRNYDLDTILPDITVLNYLNLSVGFSKPVSLEIQKEKKFSFPKPFEKELRKFSFKSYFVKLPKGAGVYKIETQVEPETLFPILKYFSIRGYPYPLKAIHEKVKITNKDMEDIISILKIKGITGREGLGE
ncbi:DNA double-strand break repair nuclease NurA [Desulfurobacterium thermolithotrophum]|uniref:DNA double-strand break repair nuclease NurA n=1 Tax=Desulfurobacterium thermolithotrophum TaxID=64160 RepID=UPI0013D1BCE2|nr:DNA double-strand break repair nuclease NurA [Desulfurobacterium thermolithotrophum]